MSSGTRSFEMARRLVKNGHKVHMLSSRHARSYKEKKYFSSEDVETQYRGGARVDIGFCYPQPSFFCVQHSWRGRATFLARIGPGTCILGIGGGRPDPKKTNIFYKFRSSAVQTTKGDFCAILLIFVDNRFFCWKYVEKNVGKIWSQLSWKVSPGVNSFADR